MTSIPTMTSDLSLIERLAEIPYSGALSDILDEMGWRNQTLPASIQSMEPGQTLVGRAMPLFGEPTNSSDPEVIFVPFLKMLGELKPGDVIVSQPNDTTCAHLGELSSETAKFRGAAGAVIDGGVRDTEYIRKLGFPVFARYRTPRDIGARWRLLAYNVPVTIGGVRIEPGDLVCGDCDGVVIVPRQIAEDVISKAEHVVDTENMVRTSIMEGMHPLEAYRKFGRF
jgi:4-hydroxy-4-methyl-2-oxoglutarate aldolase